VQLFLQLVSSVLSILSLLMFSFSKLWDAIRATAVWGYLLILFEGLVMASQMCTIDQNQLLQDDNEDRNGSTEISKGRKNVYDSSTQSESIPIRTTRSTAKRSD